MLKKILIRIILPLLILIPLMVYSIYLSNEYDKYVENYRATSSYHGGENPSTWHMIPFTLINFVGVIVYVPIGLGFMALKVNDPFSRNAIPILNLFVLLGIYNLIIWLVGHSKRIVKNKSRKRQDKKK